MICFLSKVLCASFVHHVSNSPENSGCSAWLHFLITGKTEYDAGTLSGPVHHEVKMTVIKSNLFFLHPDPELPYGLSDLSLRLKEVAKSDNLPSAAAASPPEADVASLFALKIADDAAPSSLSREILCTGMK